MPDPTLEEMGINKQWLVKQYMTLEQESRAQGKFSVATSCVSSIAKFVREEEQEEAAQIAPPPKIDIDALAAVLGKVSGLVEAGKGTANAVPTMPEVKAIRASEADE